MEHKSKQLIDMGVDVFSVLKRLGGNELLYLNICKKFTKDDTYRLFQESISHEDYQSAEMQIHTLKGVAANLGFVQLEHLSDSLLQDIRKRRLSTLSMYNKLLSEEYQQIIKVIDE